jgi:hypothetical protein
MDTIEKLEKWVEAHPEEADTPAMNVSTERTFTIREVLNELKREKETGVAIVDEELKEVKGHIENWLKEV